MANNGRIITPAVSISDLQQVFGLASGDLGTLTEQIVNGTQINLWAKFKPFYHAGTQDMRNAQRIDNSHVVSGYTIRYGVKFRATAYSSSIYDANGNIISDPMAYDKPTGGSVCPWRITDWLEVNDNGVKTGYGYNQDAVPPFQMTFPMGDTLNVPFIQGGAEQIYSFLFAFNHGRTGWSRNYCLSFGDLYGTLTGYYPTVLFTTKYGNDVYTYAMSGTQDMATIIGDESQSVIPVANVLVNMQHMRDKMGFDALFAEGAQWHAVMILTRGSYAGQDGKGTASPSINSYYRMEYAAGVDTRTYSIHHITEADTIDKLAVTIKWNGSEIEYVRVYLKKAQGFTNRVVQITIDGTFVSNGGMNGYVTVTGAAESGRPTVHQDGWGNVTFGEFEDDMTKNVSANMPVYHLTGVLPSGQKIASVGLDLNIGGVTYTASDSYVNPSGEKTTFIPLKGY